MDVTRSSQIEASGIDTDEMRRQMRHIVSPVTVVTCGRGGEARGITIGSFASTSLDPPLISFNLARSAQMHELLPFEPDFLVHILSDEQVDLSERFAIPDLPGSGQFHGISSVTHKSGLRLLNDAVLVLYCRVVNVFPAGDHSIIIGLVESFVDGSDRTPLVYFNQGYRRLGSALNPTGASSDNSGGTS